MICMDLFEQIGYPQKFEGYISSISSCPPKKNHRGSTNRAAEKPIAFRSPVHLPLLVFDRKFHRKPLIYPKYRASAAHLPD